MLKVRLLDVEKPDLLCVLCHGYGAAGDDLVDLGPACIGLEPKLKGRVAFAFPEAPHSIPGMPFGKMWWPIDVSRFDRAMRANDLDALYDDVPAGLADARTELDDTLRELTTRLQLPMSSVVVGGFSQGAMITTDLTLRADDDRAPAALAVLSGTLLCRREWTELAKRRRGMRVMQSHGTLDPLLPFDAAKALEAVLKAGGADVEFVTFRGGHGVAPNVVEALARLLASRLP